MEPRSLTVVDSDYETHHCQPGAGDMHRPVVPAGPSIGAKITVAVIVPLGLVIAFNIVAYSAHAIAAGSMYPFEWTDGIRMSASFVMFFGSIGVAFFMNREW